MATTFNWIYLGTSNTSLDPTEGNSNMENAGSFVGTTFGSAGDPLYNHVTSVTMNSTTGAAGVMDADNGSGQYDQFMTDMGGGYATYAFDGAAEYSMTVTYADGTTGTITGIMAQDTSGKLFLVPETSANNDTAVLEAKPILSVKLNSVTTSSVQGVAIDRYATKFDDGYVEGTSGSDMIDGNFVEATENGGDKIDSSDGTTAASPNDDRVLAGAGNDTVYSNLGNDTVYGGDGNDAVYGGAGNDDLRGEAGDDLLNGDADSDTLSGDAGNDTLFGGVGNDQLTYGTGNNAVYGGEGNDTIDDIAGGYETGANLLDGGAGDDVIWFGAGNTTVYGGDGRDSIDDHAGQLAGNNRIEGGTGDDTVSSGMDADTVYGGDGNDSLSGEDGNDLIYGDAGTDSLYGGLGNDTFYGGTGSDSSYGGADQDLFNVNYGDQGEYIDGGETGTDNDAIDFFNANTTVGVTVSLTSSGAGSFSYSGGGSGSFTGIESIEGTNRDDTILAGSDTTGLSLDGGGGNDSIQGGSGADKVFGGSGNDSVATGAGNDSLYGGDGNDTLAGGAGSDVIDGGLGTDTADYSASGAGVSVNLATGAGLGGDAAGDTLTGIEAVTGSAFADTLTAGSGATTLTGGAGDDRMTGGTGTGSFDMGDGNDTYAAVSGDSGADTVFGGAGNDLVQLGTSNTSDQVYGGAGNDTITNDIGLNSGNDSIYGGDGRDVISAGVNDFIDGGSGGDDFDTLTASGSSVGANVTITSSGAGTISSSGYSASFTEIEAFTLTSYSDTVSAGNDTLGMQVDAGAGNDVVVAGSGNDTLTGGTGNDALTGAAGDDNLYGGDGDDQLFGGAGADSLTGDAGDDTLAGGSGDDTVDGGAGTDRVVFSGPVTEYSFDYGAGGSLIVTDTVAGRDGVDTVTGAEYVTFGGVTYRLVTGDDGTNLTLQGPSGEPALIIAHDGNDWGGGHATSDVIFGGAGDDTLDGGDGNDTLLGEGDNDLLRGDGGNDSLLGGAGNDTLQGGTGDDTASGGTGNDSLAGDSGNDSLTGDEGQDTLSGGSGNDTLTGGAGRDLFELGPTGGADRITDFSVTVTDGQTEDQLDVSDLTNGDGSPVKSFDVVVSDDGNGNAVLSFPGGETVVLQGVSPATAATSGMLAKMGVPCFASGTRLQTPQGPRAVQDLAPGDMVSTTDGPMPVLWHGQRVVDAATLADLPHLRPIRIRQGQFGAGRDLIVSPQHGVLVAGALIRARHLALWAPGVHVARGMRSVTYHHILLPVHALVIAEGVVCESFYPGRIAVAALDPDHRRHLIAALCPLASDPVRIEGPDWLERRYGPRVRVLLTGRSARLALTAAAGAVVTAPLP